MKRESVRGTGRDQTGATSVTMQIWYELNQAGQVGLTFDEVLQKVSPRVPPGYAWRAYNRERARRTTTIDGPASIVVDTPKNRASSVRYVVQKSLSNMTAVGSALKRPDGHFAALRTPKAAYSIEQHDFDGSITRKEVALMEWLRVARPLITWIESDWKPNHSKALPTLSVAFYAVTRRLVEAHTRTEVTTDGRT